MPFYGVWIASTTTGLLLGKALPTAWDFKFALPLVFLTLALMLIKRTSQVISATLAGVLALVFHDFPHNSGFLLAVAIALGVGIVLSKRLDKAVYSDLNDTAQTQQHE